MTEYRITVPIDPAPAKAGAAAVKQELRNVGTVATETGRAVAGAFDQTKFDRSIGNLISRLDAVDATMKGVNSTSAQVAASNATVSTSLEKVAAAAARMSSGVQRTARDTKAAAGSQAAMEAATRRVLQAVDQEAAELTRLNALLADAKMLHDRGAISLNQYERVQKLVNDGVKRNTVSLGQQRAGYTQLGFQVQDITQTLALGINPLVVLAQQGGQTASAISMAVGEKGALGRAATFMSGPLGSVILATVTIVGTLGYAFYQQAQATDDALTKMKEDARETEANRRAKEEFKTTEEGVAAAIRDSTEATRKSIEATRSSAENANIEAKQNLEREISIRKVTLALLDQAKARLANARSVNFGAGGGAGAGGAQALYAGEVFDLEAKAKEQGDLIAQAERRVQQTRVDLAFEVADQISTSVGRVTREYDQQINALERTTRKQVEQGKVADASLLRQIVVLKQRKQAAIDAAQAQERLDKKGPGDGTTSFITPVAGRVTSGFGPRTAPTKGASSFHRGIDIAAPTGTPVKAAAGGVVIHSGRLGGLGNVVIVDHGGGTITEYGHLSETLAARGQKVGQGDVIGKVGSTGVSTGPHLDYRVKVGGKYVDPRKGNFRTDETAAALKAETAAQAAERKREQERDFVAGIEDQAATRGQGSSANTLNAQIAKALADFKRRFDREANQGETARITDALTAADAREVAARFDEAYVAPLKRLQALQGKTGIDREILNTQLEESARIGRDLTETEKAQIDASIRQGDAMSRQQGILESIAGPVQEYKNQIEALVALLARGAITQEQFNARVSDLGRDASTFKGGLPGQDFLGRDFGEQAKKEAADAERASDLAKLQAGLEAGTILTYEAYAIREGIERKHNETLRQINDARRDVMIGSAQSISDNLLSIAEMSVGKQNAVYKALFVASKAFAIAESVVAIQTGIAKAASEKFPYNLAAIASVIAATASIVSNIQAVSLNLADGGLVRGPGGPRDDKVPANLSAGEFVINAAAVSRPGNRALLEAVNSGSVTAGTRRIANDNAARGVSGTGGGDTYTLSFGDVVVQAGSGVTAADGKTIGRDVKDAIGKLVDERIAAAKRNGGQLTKGVKSVMSGS